MINDVLAISQMEAGRLSLHRDRINIRRRDRVRGCVSSALLSRRKDLRSAYRSPILYRTSTAIARGIRQVILNLVSNAARYTEHGAIVVEAALDFPAVTVSVTDTGPGIDPQDLEIIFEPFHQRTDSMWREQAGNGLGLAISRQFIELHGGRIWAETKLGSGSMFAFRLPISPSPAPVAATTRWINEDRLWMERTSRPAIPQLPYRQRIVLCDETGDLNNLSDQSDEEVELVKVKELGKAIDAIEEYPAHALILNTISMDRTWTVLEDARRNLPDTPIFSYTLPHAIDRSLQSGVLRYLIKPITRADLRAVLALTETPPARGPCCRRRSGLLFAAHA